MVREKSGNRQGISIHLLGMNPVGQSVVTYVAHHCSVVEVKQ